MKAKLIIGFIAIAVAALAGWNINKNQNEVILSELALANMHIFLMSCPNMRG